MDYVCHRRCWIMYDLYHTESWFSLIYRLFWTMCVLAAVVLCMTYIVQRVPGFL